MALKTNKIDINRSTTGISLPSQLSNEVWAAVQEESAVMKLAQQIQLPGSGVTIPVITGEPVADFVGETAEKPVSASTFGSKLMTPYKIAVIELFSNEFRRDMPALYDELARRLPASIAAKFDATVFNGTAPGSNFDVLTNSASIAVDPTDPYAAMANAFKEVAGENGIVNGWAMAPAGEALLVTATDGNGRPLFVPSTEAGTVGTVFGAPVVRSRNVYAEGDDADTIGFAGDWSAARYGIVDGINVSISEDATVNTGSEQVNLWQRNMFALRVEAEVGFVVRDADVFAKLTVASE